MVVPSRRGFDGFRPLGRESFTLYLNMQERQREQGRRRCMFENERFIPCRIERFPSDRGCTFICGGIRRAVGQASFDV